MSSTVDLSQVPPTRMNLQVFKGRKDGAKKGYDLLKNKADALKVMLSFAKYAGSNFVLGTIS